MNQKLSGISRIIAVFCALILIIVLFVPIWRIELSAPQYPEGLALQIHADKLAGDVDVINGLNHYIGMRTLHTDDFIEFTVLPYLIGILAAFGLLTALVNRRWFLFTWGGIFLLFCFISMIDFYRWNYNYGHNLDPAAAIRVPGMAYQPPLIGYKQLLNFGAYSIPDIGGWIFIVVAVLILTASIMEIRKLRSKNRPSNLPKYGAVFLISVFFAACSSGPKPIKTGVDSCSFCKMTITDIRYAAELVTEKGKVFIFDDINCVVAHTKSEKLDPETFSLYFSDFSSGELYEKGSVAFMKSEMMRSPMGSNTAAFKSADSLNLYLQNMNGQTISWEELSK